MRIGTMALVATAGACGSAAVGRAEPPAAPPAEPWAFEVFDQAAVPGDVLYFRLAWTNTGAEPVEVPAELLTGVTAAASFQASPAPGPVRPKQVTVVEPAPRASATWVLLKPGERLTRLGALGEWVPACAKGCPAGAYELTLAAPDWSGLARAGRQLVPPMPTLSWQRALAASTVAVTALEGLTAVLKPTGHPGSGARVTVEVTNRTGAPVWFPKPKWLFVEWQGRGQYRDHEIGFGTGEGIGGVGGWDAAEATLLAPQATLRFAVTLPSLPEGAAHVAVKAKLRPRSPFVPTGRVVVPFYFAGRLETPEASLR